MGMGGATPLLPQAQQWSILEDQMGECPLLSSAWSLPPGDGNAKQGTLRRAAARAWGALAAGSAEISALALPDPRKPVFALAITLMSVLAFVREPRDFVSHSVWALLTAAVVFEFSIGATLCRGFNRGLGTLTAGGLALAVAESAKNLGKMEEVIIVVSTFTVGFCTTLAKLYPKMKPYEYGFRVFLLTFSYVMVSGYSTGKFTDTAVNRFVFGYVMVSGYSTGKFTDTAVNRFVFIALGAGVSLGINIGICPIWAGEDLHNLAAKNFAGVANSLEGCVDEYLKRMEYERISSRILLYQASDDPLYSGYRAAIEASAQEQTLLDDAIWEPPHGPYKTLNYPWKAFTKVGGALRHCSFSAMALHGCILQEIQAPPETRKVFSSEIHRVGREGAKVLRELGNNVQTMTKLSSSDILFKVHLAAEELQKKIDEKSYLLVNTEAWYTSKQAEGIKDAMNATLVVGKANKNEAMEPNIADQTLVYHYKTSAASSFRSRYDSSSTIDGHKKLPYWPARTSFHPNLPFEVTESKTYQSASALSLATFASLLIEFVAPLQNVVYAFEELSVEDNFKEPRRSLLQSARVMVGLLLKCANLLDSGGDIDDDPAMFIHLETFSLTFIVRFYLIILSYDMKQDDCWLYC